MPLDTLKVAKQMETAGMPRAQSEALANVLNEEFVGHVVTNSDLGVAVDRLQSSAEAMEARLNARIDKIEAGLNARIDNVETSLGGRITSLEARLTMLQWVIGLLMSLQFAATLGILWRLLR